MLMRMGIKIFLFRYYFEVLDITLASEKYGQPWKSMPRQQKQKFDVTIAIQSLSGVLRDLFFAVLVEIDKNLRQ